MLFPARDFLPVKTKLHNVTLENGQIMKIREEVGGIDRTSSYYAAAIINQLEVPSSVLEDVRQRLTVRPYSLVAVEIALTQLEFKVDSIEIGAALFGQWTSPLLPGDTFGNGIMLAHGSRIVACEPLPYKKFGL